MIAVRVMQVAIDQVIDVVAVRNRGVAAARAVHVRLRMSAAGVLGRASGRIRAGDLQHVVIDVIAVNVMEMAVVQVVGMPVVRDRDVPAAGAMLVTMPFVYVATLLLHLHSSLNRHTWWPVLRTHGQFALATIPMISL